VSAECGRNQPIWRLPTPSTSVTDNGEINFELIERLTL
jgi:hypothetical protein